MRLHGGILRGKRVAYRLERLLLTSADGLTGSPPVHIRCRSGHKGVRVNKTELIEALASRTKMARADARRVVDALFGMSGIIPAELRRGRRVQITGFGTFLARRRAARVGRNPRTGKAMQIAAITLPLFRAGQALKDILNRRRR